MKPFLIFKKHSKTQVIADGCNLLAAIFNIIWMLYHRTWYLMFLFIIYLSSCIALRNNFFISNGALAFLIGVSLIYLWAYGNFWRQRKLRRSGYDCTKMIMAKNQDEALYKAL